jgi:glycosyltransferase involved in cell wall biosynthesis
VGLEFRDYPTLMEAVENLDLHVVIAAASPWSKRSDSTSGQTIPTNVTVSRFTQYELRDVYNRSAFMVMPLYENDFQAGVTALLEAMAMEKAIICSETAGQKDVIINFETGLYVPPGDSVALRREIVSLLDQPGEAKRMGQNGRLRIEQEMSLELYVKRLNAYVQQALANLVYDRQYLEVNPE